LIAPASTCCGRIVGGNGTGKLELCVGEGSAKEKPFLKELTTTNINGGKKNEWATTCREQLKKAAEINERKKEALPTSRFLRIS